MRIYKTIESTMGRTPLVKLDRMVVDLPAEVLGKLEFFNPLGSVKDRIATYMISEAERLGLINPESLLVEPTSGNTGIGLAFVAAAKGYRITLTMPDTMSVERQKLLRHLGAVRAKT